MNHEVPFDIRYIDLHSVHGTTSVLCSLVLNNGTVVVGQSHAAPDSSVAAIEARLNANAELKLVKMYAAGQALLDKNHG